MKSIKFTLPALIFTLICSTGISQVDPSTILANVDDTEQYDVLSLAKMDENLSTFVKLVDLSGLAASISMAKDYTIFVPTNNAFEQLTKEKYSELTDPKNKVELIKVLNRHILPNKVYSMDLEDSQVITTDGDEEITISKDGMGSSIYIGGATVIKADIKASNGVIHIVDAVIEPTRDVLD